MEVPGRTPANGPRPRQSQSYDNTQYVLAAHESTLRTGPPGSERKVSHSQQRRRQAGRPRIVRYCAHTCITHCTTERNEKGRTKRKHTKDKQTPLYYRVNPIFKNAPTTSTSSYRPGFSAVFLLCMYCNVLRKWRWIMSGEATPSMRWEGWRYEEEDAGEVMALIEEVMSSTRETMNFGAT